MQSIKYFFYQASIVFIFLFLILNQKNISKCNSPYDGAIQSDSGNSRSAYVLFNQKFIDGLYSKLDIDNVENMFQTIFSRLPDSVYVYPTENYYYFIYYNSGRCFWGNFRLGVEERDSGNINFVYWEFDDNPKNPDTPSWSKKFGANSGVIVTKRSALQYAVTYQNRTVLFQLNKIEQIPPKIFSLPSDEDFIFRTCDESGFQFFLIYKKTLPHFMWVLNEENGIPGNLLSLTDSILVDKTSGFAFYLDRAQKNRKILIGVRAQNVRRNNYWDGPFDQLADNYVPDKFADYIQAAYPYTKGRIDRLGIFTDEVGTRMAISPYMDYESDEELINNFHECQQQTPDEFYACIAYDYKIHFSR